ncbi:sodium:solute symporter family transporter [Maribacter sp. 2307ULW6-5]|uniref:sodium:solute symporter family transporter n=1 Tax=Maribacter sp. 2307ULW6-5 TaxID=3386275 RepID=UPI0039BC7DB7
MKPIKTLLPFLLSLLIYGAFHGTAQRAPKTSIQELAELPATQEGKPALGLAGMMGGVHKGVTLAAGGANFPDAPPWKGGTKVYWDVIYILRNGQWSRSDQTLPRPLAYGASVSLPEGVLIIGGEEGNTASDAVFLLSVDEETQQVEILAYPNLPEPLAYTAAVVFEDYLYVVGGKNAKESVNSFYRLSLKEKEQWETLPQFPGIPRALHTIAVQETKEAPALFVIGGRNQRAGEKSITPTNYLSYNLKEGRWADEGPLWVNGKTKVLMGAAAQPMGSMHLLVFGGSDAIIFDQLEFLALELAKSPNDSLRGRLIAERDALLADHPGFSNEVLAYNTMTKKWFVYDSLPDPLPVTALALSQERAMTLVSGETAPGVRTPAVKTYAIADAAEPFGPVNYTVLALYLLVSLLIGIYFSRKQKSTEDYFVGGGRIPWWASGLSVFGTLLSAITFMAIPAKSFVTDWSFFFLNITAILITPVIALIFIPFFNKLKIRTAYEYLENRFNYLARAFGSLSFILFQLGRIGIVLLLPSLAISIVTGIPVETSILIMGVLCILYTTFGGIEAVIWTDVLQVIVLLGGSVLAVVWILLHTEASFADMMGYAQDRDKFNIANMELNFTESTFWVVFIGGLASAMVTQGTDQTIVQRYLTSSSVKDSQKTLYTNAVLTLPATIIFFGIGTLLFIFYSELPQRLSPAISNNDSIFPWYIVRELPVGVSGLLVAGIFSAAMSSISSSLNSVSTAYCNDFHQHFRPATKDVALLKIARIATVLTGVLGVLLALWMANSSIKSLWDEFYKFLGLFTGGLGGMFLLGMLTKRANGTGTLLGLVVSALLIWYISVYTEINFLMYAFFGVTSCFVFGYGFSLVFREKR